MRARQQDRRARGFTLIELMITVAIVAVLASIAYPAYTDSVLKGRRAQARTALMELMQQQERYMTQNNSYLQFSNAAGTTNPSTASNSFKVFAGDSAAGTSYWLNADVCPNPAGGNFNIRDCVLLTAVPTRSDPAVGNLTLTSTGVKGCSVSTNMRLCWP